MAHGGQEDVEQKENYNWAEDDSELPQLPGKNPEKLETLKREKRDLIIKFENLVGQVSEGKPVLNLVFIGLPGCGKSSTINTCIDALSETKFEEFALAGKYNDGRQYTYDMQSFKKEKYAPDKDHLCLPTFIDLAGFSDEDSDINGELLRIILFGRLPEGETLIEARQYADKHGLGGLQNKYKQNTEELKVDRIIFVTSADQSIPENLIKRVTTAAHPPGGMSAREKRIIPIFGVMCKVDKVNVEEEEFKEHESKFISCLGLTGSEHRYTRLVNYCNDVDKDKKRMDAVFPELDVPALKFLRQVCGTSYEVTGQAASVGYEDTLEKHEVPDTAEPIPTPRVPIDDQVILLFSYLIKGLIIIIALYLVTSPPITEEQLTQICSGYKNAKQESKFNFTIPELKELCDKKLEIISPSLILLFITSVIVIIIINLIPRYLQKLMTMVEAHWPFE